MKLSIRRISLGTVYTTLLVLSLPGRAALAQDTTKPPVIKHDSTGRGACLMCHSGTMPNVKAIPQNHAGRENKTCMWCHAADAAMQTRDPAAIKHELTGRDACLMCHGGTIPNVKAVPEGHAGRENNTCSWCHVPMSG